MLLNFNYLGETLALSVALIWAVAVILFRKSGETVHPLGLNLFKNILGFVLFLPTSVLLGETIVVKASSHDYVLLFASGALGIGLADLLFLKSLNLLGAALSAIVDCLYGPFVIGLSLLFLGEQMSGLQLLGVLLIISAVLTVSEKANSKNISRRDLTLGIILGVVSMAMMAVGIVMIKPMLLRSPLLWVVQTRLVAGILVSGIILFFYPGRRIIVASVLRRHNWRFMLPGSLLGAYLAMVIWMGGMKYTETSTAAALNQTSNVFVFILGAVLLKEPINTMRIIAIILAFMGATIVTFG